MRHLRDVGAAENLTPIIWRRKDGYLFSDEPADWIEYEKKQFRLVLRVVPRSPWQERSAGARPLAQ
ncbi:hypothetical protein [Streptomyces glomeratus]|uniref:hypothetical protein n=1 Tax=Streptomyces glomeratus TaxID=284452 RepID=UPI001F268999|nr:hypothetical protein [Streptomyces glomeratus]MCF1512312.1 hypothetical protein [Streptomyces glomeratus]